MIQRLWFAPRRVGALAAGLAITVIAAAALLIPPAGAAPPDAETQTILDGARLQWESAAPSGYTMEYQLTCFCPAEGPFTVEVVDGEIASATNANGDPLNPEAGLTFDVPALFDRIQAAIDEPVGDLVVEYDPGRGYPTRIAIDEDQLASDGAFIVDVLSFRVAVDAEAQAALDAARATWETAGSDSYTMTYERLCFCIRTGPFTVEVVDGVIVSATDENGQPLDPELDTTFDVAALFDRIQEAISQPADSLQVTYDPVYGYPVSIAIDQNFGIADEEVFFEVHELTFAQAPTHVVALVAGWNLVAWTGEMSAADATAGIAAAFDLLFVWDAEAQSFLSYSPTLNPVLNTLSTLSFGDGVWIHVTDPEGAAWSVPSFVGARRVELVAGFNLVAWTGPDGADVADAVAALGDALTALYVWDAEAQTFLIYRPGGPEFANTATALQGGDGVWLDLAAAAAWEQPPAEVAAPEPEGLTGLPELDSLIESALAADAAALGERVQLTAVACVTPNGETLGLGPDCDETEEEGTLVEAFPAAACEGYWTREPAPVLATFAESITGLYAVVEGPSAPPADSAFPTGDYIIIFVAGAEGYTLTVADGSIVSLQTGCRPPQDFLVFGEETLNIVYGPAEDVLPGPGDALALATAAATADLGARFDLTPEEISLKRAEAVVWSDACLGIQNPELVCAQVLVEGWVLWLQGGADLHRYHTDRLGTETRFAEGPIDLGAVAIPDLPLPDGATLDTESAVGEEASVAATLVSYLAALADARYADAAGLFAGSYETLADMNPEIDPEDGPALLEAACTTNGYVCFRVSRVLSVTRTETDHVVTVTLADADGAQFVIEASPENNVERQETFTFTVVAGPEGFAVADLPPFVA